ncbi:retrovirus-related Pol polyprotein from transposon 17.6 [Trichonephila clavipes]|nr:retrovirus-related Pol polyprotein from transposon 17.6 [Trichonephila clavipes]
MKPPKNSKEVSKFLGTSQWYSKFIKNYADLCELLYNFKKKFKKFCWSVEAQGAFDAVKTAITEVPVLKLPDFKKPYELFTDASSIGIGAVLNQEQRPVVYASHTLSSVERNYIVTERVCLAVVWALNKFRTYLGSLPVQVISDHAALTRLTNGKICQIEEGRKITDVAREFDIAHSVVSRLWKSFKTKGMCSRRHGGGRVRSTTPAEDRYIVLLAKRNRRTTAQQVANQFLAASGKQISRKTVARRLRKGGLYARRPVVCVPLTRQHRTAHLQWCREHHNWTEQDWACVLFSDGSRFSLSSHCRRQLI